MIDPEFRSSYAVRGLIEAFLDREDLKETTEISLATIPNKEDGTETPNFKLYKRFGFRRISVEEIQTTSESFLAQNPAMLSQQLSSEIFMPLIAEYRTVRSQFDRFASLF